MAKYNHRKKYNLNPMNGGMNYNSKKYIKLLYINEEMSITDEISLPKVVLLIKETLSIMEIVEIFSQFVIEESCSIKDVVMSVVLLEILENLQSNDDEVALHTISEIVENSDFYEDTKLFSNMNVSEQAGVKDNINLKALLNAKDYGTLRELLEQYCTIRLYDSDNIIDTEPKKAISDFYIDSDGYFYPFNLHVNYGKTNIGFMPAATDTSIQVAGQDGEIVQSTKYESRLIEIFGYTEDGLTPTEKAEAKKIISEILHSIKNTTKKLTISSDDITFDVKYSGEANVSIHAHNWLEFDLPFKSASPYAKSMFENSLTGSGLIYNYGIIDVGIIFEISGPCKNPEIMLNGEYLSWQGRLSDNQMLVIDTNKSTCKIVYSSTHALNAMEDYNKAFPKAKIGGNSLYVPNGIHCTAKWVEYYL